MKFYSEKLNELFETEEACALAEKEHEEALAAEEARKKEFSNARKEAANIIDEKYKAYHEAQKEYYEALKDFLKKYGSYHKTYKNLDDLTIPNLFDLANFIF